MKRLFIITLYDLRLLVKDKMALVWLIALPIGFIIIGGAVFSDMATGEGEAMVVDLPVVDKDGGDMAQLVSFILQASPHIKVEPWDDEAEALRLVDKGDKVAALVIPEGFSQQVQSGGEVKLKLVVSAGDQIRVPLVRGIVQGVTGGFSTVNIAVRVAIEEVIRQGQEPDLGEVAQRTAARARQLLQQPPVAAEVTVAGRREAINFYDQLIPGYAMMFILFGVMGGAESILEEKARGTFKRLVIAPIMRYQLLGGKLFSHYITIVGQMLLVFAFGYFVYKIYLGRSLWALALLVLVTCFTATSLGILLTSLIKTTKQLIPITVFIILAMSAIGGSWWPLWLEPKWMQQLARLTITAWAMEGFNTLMIRGGGLMDVMHDIIALLVYGGVCFGLGLYFFKFTEE